MKLRKTIIGLLCLGLVVVFLGPCVVNAASIYMGKYEGIFVSGDLNPFVRDSFEARLQPCGSITGSHVSGATISGYLRYFDKDMNLLSDEIGPDEFPVKGRLITQRMKTGKQIPPKCHKDIYTLGAQVTFKASCKTCEGKLNVTKYFIED